MHATIEYPKPWTLPEDRPVARLPSRPPVHRPRGFSEQFDSKTVFYDCVYVKDAGAVVLQGPPFLNLKRRLQPLRIGASSLAPSLTLELKHSIREGDRHAQIWVTAEQPIEALRVSSELGETDLQVSCDLNEFFRGMRVLYTLSKNNDLDWICDWIRFHRDVHGANAVLLYDNSSTVYGVNELMSRLQAISGIDRLCIVAWPFKYGPNGRKGFWDSDFCQYGALENARWRFLQKAKSVLSCDIDEFALTSGKSVFELAESSGRGYLSFHGRWIVGVAEEANPAVVRHADFQYALRFQSEWRTERPMPGRYVDDRCPPKWAAVPARCPKTAQWMVHLVAGMNERAPLSTASYRHFRQVNTHWKYDRSQREKFDPARHYMDEELKAAFDKVRWDR
jgi:hypothetical protein